MMKEFLEWAEKALSVFLASSSTIGVFLMGVFLERLIMDEVTEKEIWVIFVVSIVMTYCTTKLLTLVKWKLYNILVEELERNQEEQAQNLYEHLRVR